jgi:transcriptional regulator with XRE-family HTH domain
MANSLLTQRLRELRKVNNYTQDYVAEVLGTTRQTYSHYETGRRKPSPETIYKLALLYNVSVDDLLHLSIEFDKNVFYEAPGPSQGSDDLSAYLEYFNNPRNQKKYQHHTNLEKELLYYFQKITDIDKKELIEIAKIKSKKQSQQII